MLVHKSHALGNDYLVATDSIDAPLAIALCDRHRGPGADGVLELVETERAQYGVRIWNPDGSIAEKSGNGLRIFARWLVDHRAAPLAFTVDTTYDVVHCSVDAAAVTVQMGLARFPDAPDALEIGGQLLRIVVVDVGNPHCVCFRDGEDLDALPWRQWGQLLEHHPQFPNRTNVQFAEVSGGEVQIRIWERGAGETSASGSSSCAAAAAAVRTGRLSAGPVVVRMPGGTLQVNVGTDHALTLRGPVTPIGSFTLDTRWRA